MADHETARAICRRRRHPRLSSRSRTRRSACRAGSCRTRCGPREMTVSPTSRMARPLEFLLGMQKLREIDRRLRVAEQLRCGGAERVDGGECRRHSVGGVGADRSREIGDALGFDLERDRRVRPAGDPLRPRGSPRDGVRPWSGAGATSTRRSSSGRSAPRPPGPTDRRSGPAPAARKPRPRNRPRAQRTVRRLQGTCSRRRRPSSMGVSPGRRSAPASCASARVRFQTAITERGRR